MNSVPFFARLVPSIFHNHRGVYNFLVVLFSLCISALTFILFTLLALLGAYLLSQRLSAGMAELSIILLFQLFAAIVSLGLFIFLLAGNLRW
jgi:hypothetical protein